MKHFNYIQTYYCRQRDKIFNALQMYDNFRTNETLIHEIRICLKKIKTIELLMTSSLTTDFGFCIKINPRLNRLFKTFGKIRDMQLQIAFVQNLKHPENYNEYSAWLGKELCEKTQEAARMLSDLEEKKHSKIIKERFNDLPVTDNKLVLLSVDKVILTTQEKITQIIDCEHNVKNLHLIRRLVKHIFYLYRASLQHFPFYHPVEAPLEQLKAMEVGLGDWHDRVVRVEILKDFIRRLKKKGDEDCGKYCQMKELERQASIKDFNDAYKMLENVFKK